MLPLSIQHILCMFGATVLVPLLLGADAGVCLLMNGVGTLLYLAICRWQIPAYLGSSFAFIAPTLAVLQAHGDIGLAAAQGGYIVFGLTFLAAGLAVARFGHAWITWLLPEAVMGALVAVIGLELAPVAAKMSGFMNETAGAFDRPIALLTFVVTVIAAGGNFRRIGAFPVLLGVVAGSASAVAFGVLDLGPIAAAPWFSVPKFTAPVLQLDAILMIAPATLVVLAEHVGHLVVTGEVVGKNLMQKPGLHRSLIADGISNVLSGFVGATPNTTYGENIGVMALTRVYSTAVLACAASLAIVMAFAGKLIALIRAIPTPVMGGVSLLLFGVIAAAGIRMLVERRVDFSRPENLTLTASVLIIGTSGMGLTLGGIEWKGMALAALAGVLLNLIFRLQRKGA